MIRQIRKITSIFGDQHCWSGDLTNSQTAIGHTYNGEQMLRDKSSYPFDKPFMYVTRFAENKVVLNQGFFCSLTLLWTQDKVPYELGRVAN